MSVPIFGTNDSCGAGFSNVVSGEGEIRTRGRLARPHDFLTGRRSQDSRQAEKIGSDETTRQPELTPHGAAMGQSVGQIDPVEMALASALEGATSAQRWDVVAQLAKELEARRLSREPNVVPLT